MSYKDKLTFKMATNYSLDAPEKKRTETKKSTSKKSSSGKNSSGTSSSEESKKGNNSSSKNMAGNSTTNKVTFDPKTSYSLTPQQKTSVAANKDVKINPIKVDGKINPIISDKEARSTKVPLQSKDGKTFGEISVSAYGAIRGDYLDKYTPVDNKEKKVLDYYTSYLNKQIVEIPITDKKTIKINYKIAKDIDDFVATNTKGNVYQRAHKLDKMILNMGLKEDELKNAKSYAGIKKLSFSKPKATDNKFVKESTQPTAKFFAGMYDKVADSTRLLIKSGLGGILDGGAYNEAWTWTDKYYTENPDELGNDLYAYKDNFNSITVDYLQDVGLEKALEYYDDTFTITKFISDTGFRTAGEMVGATGIAALLGFNDVAVQAGNALKNAAATTKVRQKALEIASKTPKIKAYSATGMAGKTANKAINFVNNISAGKVVKFLNPIDNPTTAIMGATSAQDKYNELIRNGYDEETAKTNAMFTGYINAITEKMGYDGTVRNLLTGGKTKGKLIKDYLRKSASEGLEEIYATVFERTADVLTKVGYVDEKGQIKQRGIIGNGGIFDIGAIGESFLGGFVGGTVMGSVDFINKIAHSDIDNIHKYASKIKEITTKNKKTAEEAAKKAGAKNVELPNSPDWETATEEEIVDYLSEATEAYNTILSDENVIANDEDIIKDTVKKLENIKNIQSTSVSVGDAFKDTKTGNTIRVVSRDANNTVVEIDTGKKVEQRSYTNVQANVLETNGQYQKIFTAEQVNAVTQPETTTELSVESTDVLSPEEAQKYNIVVSNLKRKAEELGLLDNNFFTALQNVNLYNPSANDRALISNEFRRVFTGNTDPLVAGWLDAIGVDASSVTSINEQNMPVASENTTSNEIIPNTENNVVKAGIKTVVDAINETLLPGARETIFANMEKMGIKGDIEVFAKRMMDIYAEKGTIGKLADYFSDGGEKVVANIRNEVQPDDNKNIIKRIVGKLSILNNTPIISHLDGSLFNSGEKITVQVGRFFDGIGNSVYREGFGEVALNKRGIKSALAHGISRAKCIAFKAIPDVIQNGIQIDYQQNWKNRNYNTVVFAGKIEIDNQVAYMGVIVKQNPKNNEYYLHEIIDGNGDFVVIKNNEEAPFKTVPKTNESLHGGASSTNNIIPQENNIVNNSVRTDAEKDTKTAKVAKAIESSLRPEITSNPTLMAMLQQRFGEDGYAALASDIILTYNQNGNIGEHEALFSDGGKAVYDALAENTDAKISTDVLNDETNSDIINDDNDIETTYSIDADDSTLYLPSREYAMVARAIMAKNAGLKDSELKPVDFVYAADAFYVYRNTAVGDFTVIDRFDVEDDFERINDVKERIEDGTYADRKGFSGWLKDIRSRERSDTRDNEWSKNRRAAVEDDRVLGGQSRSNSVRHSTTTGKDSSSDEVSYSFDEDSILTDIEWAQFYNSLGELERGMWFLQTSDGDYIFETSDKLIFTDGNYDNPKINSVVVFENLNAEKIEYGKEMAFYAAQRGEDSEECYEAIRDVLGQEYVTRTNPYPDKAYQGSTDDRRKRKNGRKTNPRSFDYSLESEKNYDEQTGDLLSNGSGEWQNSKRPRQSAKRVDGRSRRYKEGRRTASERREYCKALKDAGNTIRKVIFGHKCEVIQKEHYTKRMTNIEKRNVKNGIDETIFITGKAILPFLKDKNGNPKTTKGIFIKTKDGRKIVVVQYDHDLFMPEQVNDHELVHKDFKLSRAQKVKNLIINSLSAVERKNILERLSRDYNGIIKNNEEKIFEEFVANTLSGMNEYTSQFDELVKAYWAEDDALIDSFKISEYVESIDSGDSKNDYIVDVFPPYNESHSEANTISTIWVHKKSVAEGTQRIVSYHDSMYIIQKTNEKDLKYQIVRQVSQSELDAWNRYKKRSERNAPNKSKQQRRKTSFFLDGENRGANSDRREQLDTYNDTDKFNGKTENVAKLGREQDGWGKIENRRNRNNEYDLINSSKPDKPSNEINQDFNVPYVEDISYSSVPQITKIKYSPSGLKLTAAEREKVYSAISTDYYNKNKTHEGLQYQSCVTDTEHMLYIYEDGGFGHYNVVAKVDYADEDVANLIVEELRNGTTYRITDFIDRAIKVLELRRSGYSIHNTRTKRRRRSRGNATVHSGLSQGNAENAKGRTSKRVDGSGIGNSKRGKINTSAEVKDISYSLAGENTDFWDEWLAKIKEHGAIPTGENPARDIEVPNKINKKQYVSRFARTMMEAAVTSDETLPEFERLILEGKMTHEVITNKKARETAIQTIKEDGFEDALNEWDLLSKKGKVGKEELALGMELYNQCITNKDIPNAMKIAADLAAEATRAGQTLQACRMLKLMSPDGQLYYLERSVKKMNDEFRQKIGKKFKYIELDETLMTEFFNAPDEESRNAAYDKICQNIADQIPSTMRDKWNSWRYLAMLGNPRTHIRNIVGNAVFVPAIRIKNYVGAVIESTARVNTADRTKSFKKTKAAVEFAKKDFDIMEKTIRGENAKYAITSDIDSRRTIFKTRWIEKLRIKNFDFLEAEDTWFLKRHYVDALARVITARKLDVNTLDGKTLDTARAHAIKEAQAATYRDANELAEALNKLQRKAQRSNSKIIRGSSALIEGIMPFKKTPMNIAKQGVQYSPASIVTGVYKGLKRLKDGEAYSASDVVDDFSKGLTGTGIMLLGYFLTSIGALCGPDDEDKKKKAFDKMVGEQSYALKIGDKTYTIDWMVPSALPLFVGTELHKLTTDGFEFADIVNATSTLVEPLLELSVFSGVSDAIESAQFNDINSLFAMGNDMLTSYVLQALPTVGGQLSRIIDKNKRQYYYRDKTSDIPWMIQNFVGQAASKIPFASQLFAPVVDEWGREVTYGNAFERVFENIASPGYYSETQYTRVDKELQDLYERTGENKVLPIIQQKYFTSEYVRYHMTADEYADAKKMRGQRSFELLEILFDNKKAYKTQKKRYSNMTDEEKIKAIEKCYEIAGEETKDEMLDRIKN